MTYTVLRSIDLRGVANALPLATAAVAMLELRPGELLEVWTTDPDAPRDFAIWSRATGNELVERSEHDGAHRFVIRRR